MQEPPFLVKSPQARYFVADHCANCLTELPEGVEALYCSPWCAEIAETVRYMRRVCRDGRIENADVRLALQTRQAFLLVGGYRALGRELTVRTRAEVKVRDDNRCRQCGKPGEEIDHINGSSDNPDNLQLLCADCHHAKTAQRLVPASRREVNLLGKLWSTRVAPAEPILLADDETEWQGSWQRLKKERRQRFIDGQAADGFTYTGLKTRAEMLLARADFDEQAEVIMVQTERNSWDFTMEVDEG